MSLLPFFLGYEGIPHTLIDQDFALPMSPSDMLIASPKPLILRDYYRPWRMNPQEGQIGSTIKKDKSKFQINLDVQHFAPEEITVKTADGYVIIEGKHEEKKDEHGFISRQFSRRYLLPEGCNPELVQSKLSSDGVLSIIAPKSAPEAKNERAIPIAQTGPVRKEFKDKTTVAEPANANGAEN